MQDDTVPIITINNVTFRVPYADLLPALSADEYESLKADIAERGILVPVIIDEQSNVLDGQHRLKIAAELGITDVPFEVRPGLSDDEKEEVAIVVNALRRHMTKEQRMPLVLRLRQRGKSYREIGEALGIDPMTVYKDVQQATVEFSTVELPSVVISKDGKARPASMPRVRADSVGEIPRLQPLLEYVPPHAGGTLDVHDLRRARTEQKREAQRDRECIVACVNDDNQLQREH